MSFEKEITDALRGMIRRVTMKNVKDDGQTQTASIEVADGVWRDDIEVNQPYGFASNVGDGALGIALALGGDQSDIVLIPIANPSKRMGKLAPGEVGMYNEHGDKFVMGAGGNLDIKTGAQITITTDAGVTMTCQVLAITGNVEITGDVQLSGNLVAGGTVTDSDGNNGA
jgi:phage baseplate assembly protein V